MTQEPETRRIKHELLLKLRQGRGLSQRRVAELAGIEQRQYARYERGEVAFYSSREDTHSNLNAIAGIYSLKAEDFLEQGGLPGPMAYVQRPEGKLVLRRLMIPGKPIPIQGPWRFGKATLLNHLVDASREMGERKFLRVDLEDFDETSFQSFNTFLHDLGLRIATRHEPPIAPESFEQSWRTSESAASKLGWFLHDRVLGDGILAILVLEHVDRVQDTPFHDALFAMLRGWAESAIKEPGSHWPLLRIVVTIATEPEFLETVGDHSGFFAAAAPMIKLGHFTPALSAELAKVYGLGDETEGLVELLALVGGQPYLVHQALSEAAQREMSLSRLLSEVDFRGGVFELHLSTLRRWLEKNQLIPAMCEVMEGRKIRREEYCRIYSKGVLREVGHNSFRFDCELYHHYFSVVCAE